MKQQPGRYSFIDALRGIAAMAVVLFHARIHIQSMPQWLDAILAYGEFGVAVFFILSGFVIAHSLSGQHLDLASVGRFMLRRSIRLDPTYWVAMIIVIGFSAIANAVLRHRFADTFTVPQVISHLFYLQDILGYKDINPVFWTLAYEIQFYLAFALLLCARSPKPICAAFIVALLWPVANIDQTTHGLFVNLWFSFLLGVGIYYTWCNPRWLSLYLIYAGVILTAAIWHGNVFAIVCVATSIVILVVALVGRIGILNWRWLQFLGAISYSLYLVHNPITGATFRVWLIQFGRTPSSEITGALLSVAGSLATAWLLWRLIERPSIWLAQQVKK